ncbi:ImmA/IrrE family metallo-endopeptidase [Streptococcus uberis]|uniref:ImmA/IrrE family metallo-endopeptidase n=1 Tax=Streptococcus uberis TaxID=1349 RepID=A0A6L6G9R1_STRUB|nr:ImmA/IrrE family metallo-endopeptidase [Streptococcus uberis]MTB36495.1 ImmA/IrrE family metallo-endopeptidase [Streptococcus uberis]MTB36588.1 ImmA/IrrE family metallo-endopeptidase [Streptococcus uberis]MTB54077.1 ImmA/IrrE family metallo-endopeptidase [Streptococcus uberis]MTB61340.1 ImmA/IrrE family metallo-endopeptidase [Streptococcus uberis]MTC86021.1 ImmA/IrrE family metallo-endopeptidase [Streptococcus uberis]
MVKINDILEEYKIELFTFPETMWERSGFYFPDIRTIYVNQNLSDLEKEKVILHEIGHINHDPKHYARLLTKYENEADRFMVRELLREYLLNNDIYDFNWLQFANTYKISTTWGQQMIQEEFKNLF